MVPAALMAIAALAVSVRAQVFEIRRVAHGSDEYRITADHPARFLDDGTAQLPVGSVLSITDRDGRDFDVLLAAPMSNDRSRVRGGWAQTLSRVGAYRAQFGRTYSASDPAVFSFVVAGPDTDGDGISDENDACPFDNPAGRDADQDGCPDTVDRLPALIARMTLDIGLKQELLFEAERADQAAGRGDKESAGAFLRRAGALAASAPSVDPRYRRILVDFIANCLAAL